MEVPPVYVREDVSHPYALHGSAVPVDARSLITCGHVLRPILQVRRALDHDGGAPQESFLLGAEILGLIRVGDRDVVRAYISPSADLAVLQTRQERKVTTLRLARSLAVSSVFAFGYSIRESAVLCQQGPLALGAPLANDNGLVWLSADIGLPNGFSGGPWLSRINGLDHVMGISWLGGDGAATGRAIAAPRCLEFMKEAEPLLGLDSSKWSITDPRQIKSQVQNIVFLNTRVETATATVPVQLTVATEVSLDPLGAARNEESARAEFDTVVAPALRDVLRSRTIASIAQYWAAPEPRDVSLREQLETRVQRWLDLVASKDGTQRSVRIQINGIVDARAQYSTVIGTLIEIKDCNLTRNGVPISATAVVQVRVIDLADLGWQKLLESSERGEKWHPDIELQARVRSGVQDAFEVLVSKRAGDRPSKDSILVELSNTVEGMIRSDLGLICRISIAFNSPPEVVDYFRKTTEERKHAVERHFNRRKNIVSSLEHNEDQRLRCLTRGQSPDSEEVVELQKIIDVLEAELTKHDSRGDALESQFADAQWLLLVLSSPETRKLTGSSGERQKLID